MNLPDWTAGRTFLTGAQVAFALGFCGQRGQFDRAAAHAYARRHGLSDIKRLMQRDVTFPQPQHPHGEEGRPYWLTADVEGWVARQARRSA